jgi:nucleotide-binding universal stress UspA family protein
LKILFAVDGSEFTTRAAHYLAAHFDWFRGTPELQLLHVEPAIPSGFAVVQAERILGHDAVDRYYKEESQAALVEAEKILHDRKIPFQSAYTVGDAAREIHAYADKNKPDLIVMGSHGRGELRSIVMGSVAAKVMATTHVPVLIVR